MSLTSDQFNLQCVHGHTWIASDPDEVLSCVAREKEGYLDALCISPSDCRYCQEERKAQNKKMQEIVADWGFV